MKYPLTDYGTPEEEAWRWKFLPWLIRMQRLPDTYLYKVKYYDRPDGEDLLGKVIAINRNIAKYALVCGAMDAFMQTQTKGFQQTAGRILHYCWPAAGAATAFASITYASTKVRGKDDYFNYALGSIAAGSVIGKWQRNHVTGWAAALLFCICSYAQRIRIEEGWVWWTYKEQVPGDHRWHKFNWDIYRDPRPKGYTTSHD